MCSASREQLPTHVTWGNPLACRTNRRPSMQTDPGESSVTGSKPDLWLPSISLARPRPAVGDGRTAPVSRFTRIPRQKTRKPLRERVKNSRRGIADRPGQGSSIAGLRWSGKQNHPQPFQFPGRICQHEPLVIGVRGMRDRGVVERLTVS